MDELTLDLTLIAILVGWFVFFMFFRAVIG